MNKELYLRRTHGEREREMYWAVYVNRNTGASCIRLHKDYTESQGRPVTICHNLVICDRPTLLATARRLRSARLDVSC